MVRVIMTRDDEATGAAAARSESWPSEAESARTSIFERVGVGVGVGKAEDEC
jgi:hypothetical protein